jgi:hypothetical protein
VASHPPTPVAAAISRPQFPLSSIPQHEKFLKEREDRKEWRALAGRTGRCPRCGKPNPAGVTRRCTPCRRWAAENPLDAVYGEHRTTTPGQAPDLDGVTRYIMEGGVLEIRPDAGAVWVPTV